MEDKARKLADLNRQMNELLNKKASRVAVNNLMQRINRLQKEIDALGKSLDKGRREFVHRTNPDQL